MTPEQFQIQLKNLSKRVQTFLKDDAPQYAANSAIEHFKDNFMKEGFFGTRWKNVKRREDPKNFKTITRGINKGTVRAINNAGKAKILTGTSNLKNSIHYRTEPGAAIVYSDTEYGKAHNEGLKAGRGKGFIMPKRQFIGNHPTLTKAIREELEKRVKQVFGS
ncbi:MAG: phage virion morphogenesis protein [Bacteroidales bacterium]|jgi:phage gpG-like protein|nr:phage virion morphogenesis protein [Bacteroidales bacterium]